MESAGYLRVSAILFACAALTSLAACSEGDAAKRRDRSPPLVKAEAAMPMQFVDSIDSGVLDRLYQQPRITHSGRNLRFFQNGRLVRHKGTDLVIRALKHTRNRIEFDIIGRGNQRAPLR